MPIHEEQVESHQELIKMLIDLGIINDHVTS